MRSDNGIALILVMWIVVILSSVIAAGSYIARIEMRQAYYPLRDIQLAGAAKAAIEETKQKLGTNNNSFDSLREYARNGFTDGRSMQLGEVSLTVYVEDEESKVNINTFSPEVLLRLPPLSEFSNRDEIVDSIIDWRDPDSNPRQNGGEEEYYSHRAVPSHCKNRFFDLLDELSLIKGLQESFNISAFMDTLTVNSNGRVNINTAPLRVLTSLPGMNNSLAQSLIARRSGSDGQDGTEDDVPFANVVDARDVIGHDAYNALSSFITVRSSHFKTRVSASWGSRVKIVEVLLFREGKNVSIAYWREL